MSPANLSPMAILGQARAAGVELWAEGQALKYRGEPKAVRRLLPELRRHKAAILTLLADEAEAPKAVQAAARPAEVDALAEWESIGEAIRAGWRAEFSRPGPDGRQSIRWIPPGAWRREGEQDGGG